MILLLNLLITRSYSITTSRLDSGGFFSTQFHVAYSSMVSGAAIIAGGPYLCQLNSYPSNACSSDPSKINLNQIF